MSSFEQPLAQTFSTLLTCCAHGASDVPIPGKGAQFADEKVKRARGWKGECHLADFSMTSYFLV
jgi:hypothetical protein